MWKEYKHCVHEYIPLSDVTGRHLRILQLGDNVSNTEYFICKNKIKVDLEFLL